MRVLLLLLLLLLPIVGSVLAWNPLTEVGTLHEMEVEEVYYDALPKYFLLDLSDLGHDDNLRGGFELSNYMRDVHIPAYKQKRFYDFGHQYVPYVSEAAYFYANYDDEKIRGECYRAFERIRQTILLKLGNGGPCVDRTRDCGAWTQAEGAFRLLQKVIDYVEEKHGVEPTCPLRTLVSEGIISEQ